MAATVPVPGQRVYRIFIGYASEDLTIATAVANCFKTALPDFFAEVNFDKEFLEPGSAFQTQIEAKLQQTDLFVILYTGAEKRSHGYTGWEVGYFDHIMRTDPEHRKKISLYLYGPPDITASEQGIPLGISKEDLQLSQHDFESGLCISREEPLCKEITEWQQQIDRNIEAAGLTPHRKAEQEPVRCVHNLRLAIFQYLKGTVDTVVRPQRQITVRVKGAALQDSNDSLPLEAELHPFVGLGKGASMGMFGLPDEAITWKKFLDSTEGQTFAESWRDAITRVVLSAFPDRVDVDNSQVILASDGKTCYRVILTEATKFYNDYREYNLYFVEMLQRADYGDEETTALLKGLQLVCRFRSMFLEPDSDFFGENMGLLDPLRLPQVASTLLKELNLLRRDAQEARMDKPGTWVKYVDFSHMKTIADAYRPCESKMRDIIPRIVAAKGDRATIEPLQKQLAEALTSMEAAVRPENTVLLRQMAARLNEIVERQDTARTGKRSQPGE